MPAMVNVMLVCLLFVLIFAILGINFFKGTFYYCEFNQRAIRSDVEMELIDNKIDCFLYGG